MGAPPENLGKPRDWNVDLIPKFLMANGKSNMMDDCIYSQLSLSWSRRDPLKHFEISILRHIRFAEMRKYKLNNQISQMNM